MKKIILVKGEEVYPVWAKSVTEAFHDDILADVPRGGGIRMPSRFSAIEFGLDLYG